MAQRGVTSQMQVGDFTTSSTFAFWTLRPVLFLQCFAGLIWSLGPMLSSCERKALSQRKAEMVGFETFLTSTVMSSRGGGHRPLPTGFAEAVLWKLCSQGTFDDDLFSSPEQVGSRDPHLGLRGHPLHYTLWIQASRIHGSPWHHEVKDLRIA